MGHFDDETPSSDERLKFISSAVIPIVFGLIFIVWYWSSTAHSYTRSSPTSGCKPSVQVERAHRESGWQRLPSHSCLCTIRHPSLHHRRLVARTCNVQCPHVLLMLLYRFILVSISVADAERRGTTSGGLKLPCIHSAPVSSTCCTYSVHVVHHRQRGVSTGLVSSFSWAPLLRVPEQIDFRLAVIVYRCMNDTAPRYLGSELQRVADI